MTATAYESWFGVRAAPPETGVPPGQIASIMAEELREMPRTGFPLTLSPIVVPRESYRELMSATAGLMDLLRQAVLNIAADRAGRVAALGVDLSACPIFTDDEEFELRHCADMARADVIIGPGGPKFIEFNVSGAFGGMAHFLMYKRAWNRVREAAGRPAYISVDPYARQAALIDRVCRELGVPPAAVYVGSAADWGPGTTDRVFDVQVDALRQYGVHATHLNFDNLLDGLGLPGELRWPVGIASFTTQDAADGGYDLAPARAALDAGLRLIPSQSCRLLHSKETLALLSEGLPWMTERDTDLVDRYVPWTRVVGDRPVRWRGARHDLPRLLLEHQDDFILKGSNACACTEVYPGWVTSGPRWAELVANSVRDGGFVVQERVETVLYPLDTLTESGEVERIDAQAVISPFCIGGAGAGCYVRYVSPDAEAAAVGGVSAHRTCLLAEA